MSQLIKFLREIYIFQDLTEDELRSVSTLLKPLQFKDGETIMREGEPGQTMYLIGEGELLVTKTLTMRLAEDEYRELEKAMSKLKAEQRAVIGEMALITEDVRSATVTCAKDCLLYEIRRDDFLELVLGNPSLGFKVMFRVAELLCQRLKKTGEDVVRLTTALSIALG